MCFGSESWQIKVSDEALKASPLIGSYGFFAGQALTVYHAISIAGRSRADLDCEAYERAGSELSRWHLAKVVSDYHGGNKRSHALEH
jgi:hypothetical protein